MTDDASLALWLRLDWRFLLPVPLAGVVAYAGAVQPDDIEALHLVAGCDVQPAGRSPADVLLARDPSAADLPRLVAAVRPGGVVYVEVSLRQGRPRTLPGWARAATGAGLRDVELHWHAPDFAHRTRIVPLASPAAVRETLSRHAGVRFGRALSAGGRAALAAGVFPYAVSHGSILGRRE